MRPDADVESQRNSMSRSGRPAHGLRTAARILGATLYVFANGAIAHPPGWAVASAHPLATEAGLEIAAAGGNAFDAAVAVSAALAVVEPTGSGLGGGGFWLLHRAADGRDIMVDGRERAPLAATPDMYLDGAGAVRPRASLDGPLAAAIPGEPAALAHIASRYGRLPLQRSLQPAIRFARNGFAIGNHFRDRVETRAAQFNSSASAVFAPEGKLPAIGTVIRQPELARTLELIGQHGRAGFYEGEVADRLVAAVRRDGGIWQERDLREYQVVEREPVRGEYRGVRVVSAAPPSSGGVVLVNMLNMLEQWPLAKLDRVSRVHNIIEVMRRAYQDRSIYLGDPDFVNVDVARLTSKQYARQRVADITGQATPSDWLGTGGSRATGTNTTHLSIIDAEGNRVAATLSINAPFGSGYMAEGTGVLLNDEMDDFVAKPGEGNITGLTGGAANAIAPGKRPLSSMTPTFLEDRDHVAVIGTPGGGRIITMVLLATLDLISNGWDLDRAVNAPRVHHQFQPDIVRIEPGALVPSDILALTARGHDITESSQTWGNMQGVVWNRRDNTLSAVSDPRGEGAAKVWLHGDAAAPPARLLQ